MKRKRFVVAAITLMLSLAIVSQLPSQAPPRKPVVAKDKLTPLMQLKLERSKTILEGLALEDFDKIGQNARKLRLLSLESGWNVIQTEEFMVQSRDFRRNSQLIADAADEKDLGRATMGYVALTVRCVECHSYMRKLRAKEKDTDTPVKQKE